MDILAQMNSSGNAVVYERSFMCVMEDHLQYFRDSKTTTTITLDPSMVAVYKGDFYGYLNEVKIPKQYHWFFMRVNGYFAPWEFDGTKTEFLVPDQTEIERLIGPYISSGVIRT